VGGRDFFGGGRGKLGIEVLDRPENYLVFVGGFGEDVVAVEGNPVEGE
jgi:hypothetical protein